MRNHFGNRNIGTSAVKIGLREGDQTASLGLRLRLWWNWQTRYFEVVVGQPVQVQVLLSAPSLPQDFLPQCYPPCYSFYMDVTVKMPDQIARQWGETPDAVGRQLMEVAAIEGYRTGRLSHRQAGEMLGLDYWQTEAFLQERGVLINYSAEDLEADKITLDKILSRP